MEPPGGWSPSERVLIAEGERRAAEAEGWVVLTAAEARAAAECVRLARQAAGTNARDDTATAEQRATWARREANLEYLIGRLEGWR